MDPNVILLALLDGIGAIILYFLKQKDASQQRDIDSLWKRTEKALGDLQDYKIEVAKAYYIKPELDFKFEKMEATFKEGFALLGKKLDTINEHLLKGK